jgi:hypothetical protein
LLYFTSSFYLITGKEIQPTMTVLILLLGVLSSITLIISGLSTDRKRMLLFGIATSALLIVQYSLNHSTVALVVCAIGVIRSLSVLTSLKYPVFSTWPFLVIFLVAQTIAFIFTADWNNFTLSDALPVMGAYLGTIAVFSNRMSVTKSLSISSGLVWLAYEFTAGFYTQMIGEGFTLFANTFALIMILKAEKAGASEEELKDIDSQVIDALTGSIPVISVREALTGSIPVVKMTTDTKPLPIIPKVTATRINFPETGSLQQVTV